MPRLIKRTIPNTPFDNVSDDTLRVVEYASIGYMVDQFVGVSKDKNSLQKWLGFSLIAMMYENLISSYGIVGVEKPIPNMNNKV